MDADSTTPLLREMLAALERSPARPVDELIGTVEAMSVVEATVEEVVTREPWEALWELQAPIVVLLRETGGERVLPIWIGQPEAAELVMHRRGMKTPRPMSPDLTVALLDAAGTRVERVVIERLENNTFFATVCVVAAEPREVDAPSDALNIALRSGAPVHVATDVIDASGMPAWPGEAAASAAGPDQPPPWVPLHGARDRRGAPRYVVVEIGPLHLLAALVDSPDAQALPGLADADLDALRADVRAALDPH